jgi:hypothetical protein
MSNFGIVLGRGNMLFRRKNLQNHDIWNKTKTHIYVLVWFHGGVKWLNENYLKFFAIFEMPDAQYQDYL